MFNHRTTGSGLVACLEVAIIRWSVKVWGSLRTGRGRLLPRQSLCECLCRQQHTAGPSQQDRWAGAHDVGGMSEAL